MESCSMAGCCPFPACLLPQGTVTSTLLPVSVTFDKGEEVLKFKQACGRKKGGLEETDCGSDQLREGCSAPNLEQRGFIKTLNCREIL